MSIEMNVRLYEQFSLRTLLERTRAVTGLGQDVVMYEMTLDAIRHGAPPLLAQADVLDLLCGPGLVEQPDPAVRVATGDGVADLLWVDTGDEPDPESGVWMNARASWRNEASLLLCTYTAVAAAQLGRSVVVDESSLLGHGRLIPPDTLLDLLRRAAPAPGSVGAPGSEPYAAAVLNQVLRSAGAT